MNARPWLASSALLLACSPAPEPRAASSELVVPPIGDAGAPVVAGHVAPPPQPSKSAEEIEREECHALIRHIADIQFDTAGVAAEERAAMLDTVMQNFEQLDVCAKIDGPARACMLAAKVFADLSSCASAASRNSP